jgi:hypothetical protein
MHRHEQGECDLARRRFGSSGDRGLKPLFVIPHEKHRDEIEEEVGDDTSILFITTPGQVGGATSTYT